MALHRAVSNGHHKVVQLLLDHGAAVNAQCTDGTDALYNASEFADCEMVSLLLARGATGINTTRNSLDNTCLIAACGNNQDEIVCLLVREGADVNAYDITGQSVLMHACRGDLEHSTVTFLVDHGASMTMTDEHGETALMHAARAANEDLCLTLINHGTDLYAKSHHGKTALDLYDDTDSEGPDVVADDDLDYHTLSADELQAKRLILKAAFDAHTSSYGPPST